LDLRNREVMLTAEQQERVFRVGWLMDHDWEFLSCLLGEPFLEQDLLFFFDGSHLSICTWPVDRSLMRDGLVQGVWSVLQACLKKLTPCFVDLWGPEFSMPCGLPGFRPVTAHPGCASNVNLQIHYENYALPANRNIRNALQAKRSGLQCVMARARSLTWKHMRMFEDFLQRPDIGPFDRTYTCAAPSLAWSEKTVFFNAYEGDRLVGFIGVRECLENVAIATWAAYEKEAYKVSDFLQLCLIDHYFRSGIPVLDLGYSIRSELLTYKLRWGANANNGSYADFSFARSDYDPSPGNRHWLARSLSV
jgi:hypothetical protein